MKKLIAVLLMIAALFCFTACGGNDAGGNPAGGDPKGGDPTGGDPTGGDPTGGVDATTLDGYYVQTFQLGGKPVNGYTWVIKGDTRKKYEFINENAFTTYEEYFNNGKQVLDGTEEIIIDELSFTIDSEPGVYTLVTTEEGTFLNCPRMGMLEKVVPGTTGTVLQEQIYYINGNLAVARADEDDETLVMFLIKDEGYMPLELTKSGDNTFRIEGLEDDDDVEWDDAKCTVTFTGTTAVISDVSGTWPSVDGTGSSVNPVGSYTKFVRTTPWPVAPAN